MDNLNYHHLRYFREVAHDGNLTRTAERVNLSQSALSSQIRTLEERLGHELFERTGRKLRLTEVGRIVLDHADRIFGTGEELVATLKRTGASQPPLRLGALSTLSRNFQLNFLRPLIGTQDVDIILKSGSAGVLFEALKSLALDVMLTTEPPSSLLGGDFTAHRIAEQSVGIHGIPARLRHESLRDLLAREPLIVPTESSIRTGFESLIARLGVTPRIAADVRRHGDGAASGARGHGTGDCAGRGAGRRDQLRPARDRAVRSRDRRELLRGHGAPQLSASAACQPGDPMSGEILTDAYSGQGAAS